MQHIAYWALALTVFCVVMAQAGYAAHAVLIYSQFFGFDLIGSAGIWSLSSIAGALARLSVIALRPSWTPRHFASGVYLVEAVGFALLGFGVTIPGITLGAAIVIGMTASLTLVLEPLLATHCFATESYGSLYGPIYCGNCVAAALGAFVYGLVVSTYGTYQVVLLLMAMALMGAAGLVQLAKPLTVGK
jgi:hypothetical protein